MARSEETIPSLLHRLWFHIGIRRRAQLAGLLLLTLIASVAEIVSIGAVLPFLGVLTDREALFSYPGMGSIIRVLGISSPDELLLPLSFGFAAAALLSGAVRLLLQWSNTRISFAVGSDLSYEVYRKTLYQPYWVHVSRNSSEVIAGITAKTSAVVRAISDVMSFLSSSLLLIGILFALFAINPVVAAGGLGGFGGIYAFIIKATRKRQLANGDCVTGAEVHVLKLLQEGLGGIRDMLLDGTQQVYLDMYRNTDVPMRRAQGRLHFLVSSPRFVLEALGMTLIAALAYAFSSQSDHVGKAVPVLGALALGAQRLLPVLQSLYGSWSGLLAHQASLRGSVELLDQPVTLSSFSPAAEPVPFDHAICLRNVSFRYAPDLPLVLDGVDLEIRKGSQVGFIGSTGSGKSTLIDIIMGLLQPTSGQLTVDGVPVVQDNRRAWQAHLAHVPQFIFLSDASVEENIAFGVPAGKIDRGRVMLSARKAQLSEAIERWPKKYQTLVGERGIRLSGGQRQRIGIARALYKEADVIVFDEATSALDNKTEASVMEAIEGLGQEMTLLIIAHRLTTLKKCDLVVELADGKIIRSGTYDEIVQGI